MEVGVGVDSLLQSVFSRVLETELEACAGMHLAACQMNACVRMCVCVPWLQHV